MIKVLLFKKGTEYLKVEISGHSGYAEYGKDIVCSAVSILSQAALNGMMKFSTNEVKYKVDGKSGFLSFEVPNPNSDEEKIRQQTIVETLRIGILGIIDDYKAYVKLEELEL
ncbi:MAG: ribosomal-processing cysteine protease Prp [Clostridia bacterium]|nr:ribosomal-processing cysteine protease Prp [Clostridia bacterium]